MYKVKGGAARGLTDDDYNFLYSLGFDEGELEMVVSFNPYIRLDNLIGEYIRVAHELYNVDISDIEEVSTNNSDVLSNSNVNKRSIARDVVHYFSNEGRMTAGYRKRSRKIRGGMSKKSRSKRLRTRKNRKYKNKN